MRMIGVLVVLCIFLPGCGTMFAEKTQKISFISKPPKAEVVVGSQSCITPCTLEIDKKRFHLQAMVSKDGYGSQSIILVPQVEPWTWLNCLGNMCLGMAVDYVTGTIFRYDPDYYVALSKGSGSTTNDTFTTLERFNPIKEEPRAEPKASTQREEARSETTRTDLSRSSADPAKHQTVVNREKVKLRKKPSEKAVTLKTLRKGEEVQLVKIKGDWCLIELASGETGWCLKSSLAQ